MGHFRSFGFSTVDSYSGFVSGSDSIFGCTENGRSTRTVQKELWIRLLRSIATNPDAAKLLLDSICEYTDFNFGHGGSMLWPLIGSSSSGFRKSAIPATTTPCAAAGRSDSPQRPQS